ncbi:hypothetical protein FZEAL_6594 [Fusarium zealandicum]|uniref:Uncharacterized protein n=1 Tax=Fusarium zealandicum TaxID=1053134 RepID=A0A8H4UIA2_9HYPO|nr:hypothetical protein FZEAL_6594 [Fusarium zealandicum]
MGLRRMSQEDAAKRRSRRISNRNNEARNKRQLELTEYVFPIDFRFNETGFAVCIEAQPLDSLGPRIYLWRLRALTVERIESLADLYSYCSTQVESPSYLGARHVNLDAKFPWANVKRGTSEGLALVMDDDGGEEEKKRKQRDQAGL